MTCRVGLVSAAAALRLDEDLPPLVGALREAGIEGIPVVWDDAAVEWGSFSAAVVRSTWDYAARREEFLAWADRVAASTRLFNPPRVLRWNTDKVYLRELARAGVPVVPTGWIAPGEPVDLPRGGDFVVKPSVSAGAMNTARYSPDRLEAAADHVRRLQREGRTAMVQPYLSRLDEAGETGMVYIAGEFSHAIRKGAILKGEVKLVDGLYAEEELSARGPDPAEREVGRRVMEFLGEPLLYARVDVAPGPEGSPVVLELELAEPSLFFKFGPGSAARLARAIAARIS
jgi:glutathione synthase/RimK-type ligase-like ATP-grasp enzyme